MNQLTVSEQGLALIKQFEGFSQQAYLCPAGKPTIGYGHVIRAGESYPDGISREAAEKLLISDCCCAEEAISLLVEIPLNQHQFDALAAFIYNIGTKAFEKSTLLRILNAGNLTGATSQFNRWIYANGQKMPGLIRRRAAESALFSQSV